MKTEKFSLLPLAAFIALAAALPAQAATVVYQDNFDNDGLATNTGTGGGLGFHDQVGGPWVENGDLVSGYNGDNDRGNVYSANTFNLTGGFKLEVTYTTTNFDASTDRINIGLLDANDLDATDQPLGDYITDPLDRAVVNKYAIGLNLTTLDSNQGLNFNDGAGTLNQLSNAQTIAGGTQSLLLEVDASGDWSYSINGATATTGTSAFDVTRDYHFFVFHQNLGAGNDLTLNSVTLTQIPEPSSAMLLGLSGLALLLRRRRRA